MIGGVALLAEGVDRNCAALGFIPLGVMSPSSRRAWIEILMSYPAHIWRSVALLAEGVDRNHEDNMLFVVDEGRPPRGGRG